MLLSKSDFKVARTCGTKLYYRKLKYPTALDDDPYVEFLADGGYMVEAIAKVLFPEGREIIASDNSPENLFSETRKALANDDVTLFQASLIHEQLFSQVDILEKRGNKFRLIEVKAKSVEPKDDGSSPFRKKKEGILAKWIPYLEDVAFQTHVLRSIYPDAEVTSWLCLVDKTQTSAAETSFEHFHIEPRGDNGKPQISFTGDVRALRAQPFVRILDVTSEVDELLPEVKQAADRFAASVKAETPERLKPTLGVECKHCEYRLVDDVNNGFRECWKELADSSPHLLDLYRIDSLDDELLVKLIADGKSALTDISSDHFKGRTGERQAIQLEWTLKNEEFIDPRLKEILSECKFPLHFLDFEASRLAVPYHAGMRPYGQVAFQWSCHTIPAPGAQLVHREWINIGQVYPNFEFARSLKEVITGEGTVFTWSAFERSALKDIRDQMSRREEKDPGLDAWLQMIVDESGPIVDLYELAKDFYFHPDMKGSLSIKKVLPAVWFHNASLHGHPWFSEYFRELEDRILDPYETLGSLPFGDSDSEGEVEAVREGTGAIRTYQEMMFGARRSDTSFRAVMKQLLLNYCKLDTAAMVMIWMHWRGRPFKKSEGGRMTDEG